MIGYRSTRSPATRVEGFRAALLAGQPADGGLFVPEEIPALDPEGLRGLDFAKRAAAMLAPWLEGDIAASIVEEISRVVFDFPVPIVQLEPGVFLVELFHGPTAAFKDFGARFMAHTAAAMRDSQEPLTVLVATSGDTGAAVAHAFSRLPRTHVVLLYPAGRVSPLQELQLTAVPGNVSSLRVEGTFDDCQRMVREALANRELVGDLGLVPANSINVARLLPQITYYAHAVAELASPADPPRTGMPGRHRAAVTPAPPLVVVPSGNLGNLTAGVLARRQGAPIGGFLAAVNRNDTFARFLATGKLRRIAAVATPSNAMDVGNPSNLERLRFLYDDDVRAMRREIRVETIDDDSTRASIRRTYEESGRFVCPHTAVALAALRMHRFRTEDRTPALVLATAHPGKFADIVGEATGQVVARPPALAALERSRRQPRSLHADPAALEVVLRRLS